MAPVLTRPLHPCRNRSIQGYVVRLFEHVKECMPTPIQCAFKADGVPTERNTIHGHTAVEKFQCRQMLEMAH